MRLAKIKWKRDPYNTFDRMRDDPWNCLCQLRREGADVVHEGVYTWQIEYPKNPK